MPFCPCATGAGLFLWKSRRMDGVHLLGEWYDCPADTPELTRAGPLRALCLDAATRSGLTVVGDCFYQFEPQGVGWGGVEGNVLDQFLERGRHARSDPRPNPHEGAGAGAEIQGEIAVRLEHAKPPDPFPGDAG